MSTRGINALIATAVIAILGYLSIFIVDERQKALVLRFGQITQVVNDPGLHFKWPVIENVAFYDARIQALDTPEQEVTPSDDRRLSVDAFARYRIVDLRAYRTAIGATVAPDAVQSRLNGILNDEIRAVLGSEGVTSGTILSPERRSLMARIQEGADREARQFGIEIIDVRLKQTNLPEQNLEATFARMIAEREREAADEIARGREAAQAVQAAADRQVTVILSEARRDADIIRGEADAQRANIFAQAFGQDQEFFEFYRSLIAYERALQQGGGEIEGAAQGVVAGETFFVMRPDDEFFSYFRGSNPTLSAAPETAGAPAGNATNATEESAANSETPSSGDPTTLGSLVVQ